MNHPAVIDEACCIGCTQCKLICPAKAIVQYGIICRVAPSHCIHCAQCLGVCPLACIREDADCEA